MHACDLPPRVPYDNPHPCAPLALPSPCSEREYKPLCAGLFLTRRHWNGKERRLLFTEAFPNK